MMFYPEEVLIPWVAMQLQRPIKWIEDRQEHFYTTAHDRRVARWTEAGVQIELADRPVEDSLLLQELITHVHASLWRWRRQKRKQQIVAASILSALALIAMAVLFWLVPPDLIHQERVAAMNHSRRER